MWQVVSSRRAVRGGQCACASMSRRFVGGQWQAARGGITRWAVGSRRSAPPGADRRDVRWSPSPPPLGAPPHVVDSERRSGRRSGRRLGAPLRAPSLAPLRRRSLRPSGAAAPPRLRRSTPAPRCSGAVARRTDPRPSSQPPAREDDTDDWRLSVQLPLAIRQNALEDRVALLSARLERVAAREGTPDATEADATAARLEALQSEVAAKATCVLMLQERMESLGARAHGRKGRGQR